MSRTATMSKTLALAASAADGKVINFWFNGQTETDGVLDERWAGDVLRSDPAPSGSGWSMWIVGDATAVATLTITVTELNKGGKYSADTTTIFNAEVMGNSEVFHASLGTMDRCSGIRVVVAEANGAPAGNFDLEVVYESHN